MTRRGSLAYYACGLVVGSCATALTYFPALVSGKPHMQTFRNFLFVYFFTLLMSVLPLLLTAWLLRLLVGRLPGRGVWPWLAAGTVLGYGVVLALGAVAQLLEATSGVSTGKTLAFFLFMGPWLALQKPLWLLLPPALVLSYFLYRVQRAFDSSRA
jgi:hypothetical protein